MNIPILHAGSDRPPRRTKLKREESGEERTAATWGERVRDLESKEGGRGGGRGGGGVGGGEGEGKRGEQGDRGAGEAA